MSAKTVTRRGQSKAPPDLEVLIGVANRLKRLPDAAELFAGKGTEVRLSKLLKSLTKEQREFLGPSTDKFRFRNHYDAFVSAQQYLPLLADLKLNERSDYELNSQFTSLPSAKVDIYIQDGQLASSGVFITALDRVPANRIRRCAVCSSIFWATRNNSECCSEQHRKRFNKANSRKGLKSLSAGRVSKKGTKQG